jgi:hypothetical protein
VNRGDITANGPNGYGIHALTLKDYADIVVQNHARIEARSGVGILIQSSNADALVQNYGVIVGGDLGVLVSGGGYEVGVINHGTITADSLFAVEVIPGGGYGAIVNFGLIKGYIEVFALKNEFVFVIGSLWGNFTDPNQATLTSTGTAFRFEDDLDDVWGDVSAGVNFFNSSATTAVFAKVDVTFGEDVAGVGGKAGMRVSW